MLHHDPVHESRHLTIVHLAARVVRIVGGAEIIIF